MKCYYEKCSYCIHRKECDYLLKIKELGKENSELKKQIEKMKSDLVELKENSFNDEMNLVVDELVRKWKCE